MWKLDPTDLDRLRGAGGEDFADFMNLLIRAEGATGGLAQSEIATQLRANIPDGGVDTEVKQTIPRDASGWFAVPTCWQFKAVEAKDIDAKRRKTKQNELQTEINKPYAKKLIERGYGYRLCVLGDVTPQKVANWESQLKQEALRINDQAPAPRVIGRSQLLPWAECFTGIVASLLNPPPGIFHWQTWADNRRALTPQYVPNTDWDSVRRRILDHVQFDRPCAGGDPCLFIGGAAGVGKTRLVLESLAELQQAPALVLIVEDDQDTTRIASWLANERHRFAILIADECSPQVRYSLNANLRGHVHRVRVISVDNTGELQASAAGRVLLSPADALKNTEPILAANFSDVPEDRRRQYAQLSKGFIRLAADMCKHDAGIVSGDMGGILGDVERYARHRLGKHLDTVSVLALFHKVGFRDDVAGELDLLCQLTGYSVQQCRDGVRATREAPGFLVQAGRYWYVTPEIVARVLFNEAWQRWVAHDLEGFLKKLPDELRQQLIDRVATHGGEEVRQEVLKFFRAWFAELTAHDLSDPQVTSLASAVIETSPEEYLPRLRSLVEGAQPRELEQIQGHAYGAKWGPRRTLVWLLEGLVSFPEYFSDCEASLFRLALEESEQQIGNNATAIWANLFSIYLSGTALPFQNRLPVLERRTESTAIAEARLAFVAVSHALHRSQGHIIGEPIVAGRLRPDDWQPATVREERDCYRRALAICERHLCAGVAEEHHRLASKVLTDAVHHLLHIGLADDLRRIVVPERLADEEVREWLKCLDEFLSIEQRRGPTQTDNGNAKYVSAVQDWANQLRPTDFPGKLRSVFSRNPWDERFSRDITKKADEADELAATIRQQPALLTPHLDWLAGPEALSSERLGFALGRIDADVAVGNMIFSHAIAFNAAPLLRGYVRGMVFAERQPSAEVLALMAELESTHPTVAVDVLGFAGDSFDAFNRILRLVDSHAVSPRYLAGMAMGLGRRELTREEVNRVLPYFTRAAQNGETETALAGVRFLETYLLFEARRDAADACLTSADSRSLVWELVESSLPYLTSRSGSEWGEIVKQLAAFDADRAAKVLAKALLSENVFCRHEAEKELEDLAKTYPSSVMNGFGSALLNRENGWMLQVAVCRDIISQIPDEVVHAWLERHGIEGARAIARHLPVPGIDKIGSPSVPKILDHVLREYDDDKVFRNFLAGSGSAMEWPGNGGDQFRLAAEEAKKFLDHPNRRIREWARREINHRLQMAELEDQEHEERLLPS